MIEQFSVRGRDLLRTAVLIEGQEVPLVFLGGQWVRADNGKSLDPSLTRDLGQVLKVHNATLIQGIIEQIQEQ